MRWATATRIGLCAALALGLTLGCMKKDPHKDPFFDKWEEAARQTQGHTPVHDPQDLSLNKTTVYRPEPSAEKGLTQRPLPTQRISLKFSRAPLPAVIQSLARISGQSIMVSPKVAGEVNVDIRNMPWDQVFAGILHTNGLSFIWEGDIVRVVTLEDMEHDIKLDESLNKRLALMAEKKKVEPPMVSVVKLKYAAADKLKPELEKLLTKGEKNEAIGSITVDASSNSLILQTLRSDAEKIVRLMDRLDRPRPQVRIKAHIVEANSNTARALGLAWSGQFLIKLEAGSNVKIPVNPNVNLPPTMRTNTATGGFGQLGFGIPGGPGTSLEATLYALQDDNKLRILSSPTLTTLDHEKAVTANGVDVPYQSITGTPPNQTVSIVWKKAELKLEIEPGVIDPTRLRMKILITKDEVDPIRNVAGNPYMITKRTETSLVTGSDETVVISGLTKRTMSGREVGIPGAKDIPMLGWLFKSEDKGDQMEEVLIFITPTILPVRENGEPLMEVDSLGTNHFEKGFDEPEEDAGGVIQ